MDRQADRDALTLINVEIGDAENKGQTAKLLGVLAEQTLWPDGKMPLLGFRRGGGACVDARAFLESVKEDGDRKTEIKGEDIIFFGKCRAIAPCIVTMKGQRYHNVRLFVRASESGPWKLLGWANEPL